MSTNISPTSSTSSTPPFPTPTSSTSSSPLPFPTPSTPLSTTISSLLALKNTLLLPSNSTAYSSSSSPDDGPSRDLLLLQYDPPNELAFDFTSVSPEDEDDLIVTRIIQDELPGMIERVREELLPVPARAPVTPPPPALIGEGNNPDAPPPYSAFDPSATDGDAGGGDLSGKGCHERTTSISTTSSGEESNRSGRTRFAFWKGKARAPGGWFGVKRERQPVEILECTSCMDDFEEKKTVKLGCSHRYCEPCLKTLIMTALDSESHFPPKCCLTPLTPSLILSQLPRSLRPLYRSKATEYSTPLEERIYCPYSKCGTFIPPGRRFRPEDIKFRCPKCSGWICRWCHSQAHEASECPKDEGLRAVLMVAQEMGWQRCWKCKAVVELNTGCDHMTCRCKAEFCYRCAAKWKTCNCTSGSRRDEAAAAATRAALANGADIDFLPPPGTAAASESDNALDEDNDSDDEEFLADLAQALELSNTTHALEQALRGTIATSERAEIEREVTAVSERWEIIASAVAQVIGVQREMIVERWREEREALDALHESRRQRLMEKILIVLEGLVKEEMEIREDGETRLREFRERQADEEDAWWGRAGAVFSDEQIREWDQKQRREREVEERTVRREGEGRVRELEVRAGREAREMEEEAGSLRAREREENEEMLRRQGLEDLWRMRVKEMREEFLETRRVEEEGAVRTRGREPREETRELEWWEMGEYGRLPGGVRGWDFLVNRVGESSGSGPR